jgi:hypothetical protein
LSIFYADRQFSELSDLGKNKNTQQQNPYSLKQAGTLDLDALIWAVSDKLKSKIDRLTGKNTPSITSHLVRDDGVGTRNPAEAGPYGIGFAATDRLWQAEEARLDASFEEGRAQRRRYVLAGLLLLVLAGVIGYAWSGPEPVPVVPESPASLAIDPPVVDPLTSLADSVADMPALEALAPPPKPALVPAAAPLTVAQPAAIVKAPLIPPQVKRAMPVHPLVNKAVTAPKHLGTRPRTIDHGAPAPVAKSVVLNQHPQSAPQGRAVESQPLSTRNPPSSLVRVVRPPADIGSKPAQPEQAGSRPSAFSPLGAAQPASNRTAQNSSNQSSTTPYNPKPLYPPADVRDTPPPAAPQKLTPQGMRKPTLIDAMFPRLYLLSESF